MVASNDRKRRQVLHALMILALLGNLSCSVIAGTDTEALARSGKEIRLDYVETLRNQASLQGRSFQQVDFAADPTRSLVRPSSVFADNFRVYVTDLYTSGTVSAPRVFIFDRGSQTVTILPTPASAMAGRLLSPSGIVVSAGTLLFVADEQQGKVFGYDRNGALAMVFGKVGDLVTPVALAIDARRNRLYVADSHAHQVRVYTPLGDRVFEIGGTRATGPEGLRSPSSVALDRDGRIYVLDSSNRRVHVYDPDGNPLQVFPVSKGVPGGPWQPKAIAVDSAGHVYAADSIHNKILIFDRDGQFVTTWGKTGSMMGDFWTPVAMFIDDSDKIYIADQTNSRIQVYQFSK